MLEHAAATQKNVYSKNPRDLPHKKSNTSVLQIHIFHGLGREKMGSAHKQAISVAC